MDDFVLPLGSRMVTVWEGYEVVLRDAFGRLRTVRGPARDVLEFDETPVIWGKTIFRRV